MPKKATKYPVSKAISGRTGSKQTGGKKSFEKAFNSAHIQIIGISEVAKTRKSVPFTGGRSSHKQARRHR